MIGKFFGIIFGAVFILAVVSAGPGVWLYENRFAGYHFTGVPIFHWFSFTIPPGLGVQLASLKAQEAAAQARTVKLVAEQGQITKAASAQETAVQTVIRTRTITLTREVPTYVSSLSDADCTVPVGFVRLHDASAAGLPAVPESAGKPNDAPSGVKLSTVAETVVGNYGAANANAAQLEGLQAWVRAEAAAK